jgi:hypothetical protein
MFAGLGPREARSTRRGRGRLDLSISNILANVLNKFALQGYLFTEQVVAEGRGHPSVSDFKAGEERSTCSAT